MKSNNLQVFYPSRYSFSKYIDVYEKYKFAHLSLLTIENNNLLIRCTYDKARNISRDSDMINRHHIVTQCRNILFE